MDLQLKTKVVLVTGGAKGIGAAIVRASAAEGAIPVICDRDPSAANALCQQLRDAGWRCEFFETELTSSQACKASVEATLQEFGRLDALVNNAGVNDGIGLQSGSPEKFAASLERNLHHYYYMAHYALPALKR